MSAIASGFRIAAEVLGGILLAGLVAGLIVPLRPEAFDLKTMLALGLLCVGAVVLVDWQLSRRR